LGIECHQLAVNILAKGINRQNPGGELNPRLGGASLFMVRHQLRHYIEHTLALPCAFGA